MPYSIIVSIIILLIVLFVRKRLTNGRIIDLSSHIFFCETCGDVQAGEDHKECRKCKTEMIDTGYTVRDAMAYTRENKFSSMSDFLKEKGFVKKDGK